MDHRLHLSESKIVDGGVVVWRYRAFCSCHWYQKWATRYRNVALEHYETHIQEIENNGITKAD